MLDSTFCSSADHEDDAAGVIDGEVTSAATLLCLTVTKWSSSVINLSTNSLAGSGPAKALDYQVA